MGSGGDRGRDSHIRVREMPVVSLMGVNCRIWFHLGCLGRKVSILAHLHSFLDVCFSMVSFRKGVILSLSHTHIGVPWGFNFSFSTSIPISVIGEYPQGTILGERLSEMVFIKNFKLEIPIINF